MADLVRASHPVFGTRLIPESWLTTYPGAWTVLDDEDPGPGPDPLPPYVRDVDLEGHLIDLLDDEESAFSVRQRAAFDARFAPLGAGVGRVTAKMLAGQDVKVTFIGDSGLEGGTATTPGTDDTASLVVAGLGDRYGVTVTKSNRANSGYRSADPMIPSVGAVFTDALADAADLYVISFGHNDISSDIGSPGRGYPREAAMGALEHMIRRIRVEVPDADIVLSSQWPYVDGAAASNTALEPHGQALRALAAAYGCEFIDYYGALVDLGVLDGGAAASPYIDATQHPTSGGHEVWADAILARFPMQQNSAPVAPSLPLGGLYRPWRYDRGGWKSYSSGSRVYGSSGYRFSGAGWSSTTAAPSTSSTAGNSLAVRFRGTEAFLRLDTGAGQGVVTINVDGTDVHSNLNLSTISAGQRRLPIICAAPGLHSIVVTIVSGSVTFRGVDVLTAPVEWIDAASPRLTFTGTFGAVSTSSGAWNNSYRQSTTLGDSLTFSFVGTACGIDMLPYSGHQVLVAVDGAAAKSVDISAGAAGAVISGRTLVEGLAYGHHTVTVTSTGARNTFLISGVYWWDETRLERPCRVRGRGVVGETVRFPSGFGSAPAVRLSATDATSAVPPYATGVTADQLVLAGTASAVIDWEAEGARIAW